MYNSSTRSREPNNLARPREASFETAIMENFANSISQDTEALADTCSSRINIPRTHLASKTRAAAVTRTTGDKANLNNTLSQKKQSQKRLSPHPAQLLRSYGVNMENDRSRMPPRSSKALDPRSTRNISNTSTRPCTPSQINHSILAQHNAAAVGTVIGNSTNLFTPTASKKSSPLDKELPPKPILRESDSPERRGIFDATDSASKSLNTNYPPLQPNQSGGESPSDGGSFKTTPSLHSAPEHASTYVELGTAVTKTTLKASASAIDLHSPFPSKFGALKEQIIRPSSVNSSKPAGYSISAPRVTERRATSFGHVASQKNGSPIQRKPVSTKTNRHEFRGYEALSTTGQRRIAKISLTRVEDTLYRPPKRVASNSGRPLGVNAYQKGFTTELHEAEARRESCALSNDDSSRRSIKYGVGATVRFSNDAHEVIMGDIVRDVPVSPYISGTFNEYSRLGGTNQTLPKANVQPSTSAANNDKTSNRKSLSTSSGTTQDAFGSGGGVSQFRRASKQLERENFYRTRQEARQVYRQAGIAPHVAPLPPRSSSLPNSPNSFHDPETPVKKVPDPVVPRSFADRMARPTAASAAREAQAKISLLQRGKNTLKKKNSSPFNKSTTATKAVISSTTASLQKSGSLTSIKKSNRGFKTRFSSILPRRHPSRRRSDQVKNVTSPKRTSTITVLKSTGTIDQKLAKFSRHQHNVSRNLTTFENSGMEFSPSDIIRTYPGGNIYWDPTDKFASEREEQNRHAAEHFASEAHVVTNAARQNTRPIQSQGPRCLLRDEEDPPTPPLTRDGPDGHYIEEEGHDVGDPLDETGVSRYLDQQLSDAQDRLNHAIEAGQGVQNQEVRDMIGNVVQLAGNAIHTSREARMANIALNNAVAGLVRQTNQLTLAASSAATVAASAAENSA